MNSRDILSVSIVLLAMSAVTLAVVYRNSIKANSYSIGCQEVFNDIYNELGLKNVDPATLKSVCDKRAERWLK